MPLAPPCPGRRPARKEVLWTSGGFVALCAGFILAAELRFPEWYDREYTVRKELLKDRMAESPGRPLLAVIGSSRAGTDISPDCLPPVCDAAGRQVLVFNYSHYGGGPRMNRVQLHRLLRDGMRPDWLVIELLPAYLRREGTHAIETAIIDFPALLPYENRANFLVEYARLRLDAPYRYRTPFLRTAAPPFATTAAEGDDVHLGPMGDDQNFTRPGALSPERRVRQFEIIRRLYADAMRAYSIDPLLAAAARDLLRDCREQGIPTVLLIGPEDSRFRSWYGPGVEATIREFYAGLGEEFGVPFIDARRWSPDEDFLDPHHLTPDGAKRFTLRLEREVLAPLVRGRMRTAK